MKLEYIYSMSETTKTKNIAKNFISKQNITLDKYWNRCDLLSNLVSREVEGSQVITIEPKDRDYLEAETDFGVVFWNHHVVVEYQGLIHDAWDNNDKPLKLKDYLKNTFSNKKFKIIKNNKERSITL